MVKCSCPSFWQFNVKSKTKVVWRSSNTLKIILHSKVIFTRNSCLDSQIEIPAFFFFMAFSFVFISLINASIYSSFVLNYLPSQMLAVFALCHSLGGALANFDATRGLGICQPRGPRPPLGFSYDHGTQIWLNIENTKRFFCCRYSLKSTSSNMCCVSLHFFRSLCDKWLSIYSSDSSIVVRHDF